MGEGGYIIILFLVDKLTYLIFIIIVVIEIILLFDLIYFRFYIVLFKT